MKLFPSRKLSDPEFVERTRKYLQKGKRWAWIGLIFSGAFFIFLIYFLIFAIDWFSSSNKAFSENAQAFHAGFLLGCMMGMFVTFLLAKTVLYFWEFLNLLLGNRRDKLLVAYYDQLHPLDAKAPAPSNVPRY
jgi:hypothetical protein